MNSLTSPPTASPESNDHTSCRPSTDATPRTRTKHRPATDEEAKRDRAAEAETLVVPVEDEAIDEEEIKGGLEGVGAVLLLFDIVGGARKVEVDEAGAEVVELVTRPAVIVAVGTGFVKLDDLSVLNIVCIMDGNDSRLPVGPSVVVSNL